MEPEKKSNGALIGSIIIIVILIIGGIYIWQTNVKELQQQKQQQEQQVKTTKVDSTTLKEIDTLGQEISSTDTSVGVSVDSIQ